MDSTNTVQAVPGPNGAAGNHIVSSYDYTDLLCRCSAVANKFDRGWGDQYSHLPQLESSRPGLRQCLSTGHISLNARLRVTSFETLRQPSLRHQLAANSSRAHRYTA